jgi:transcription antitermination factor NusG
LTLDLHNKKWHVLVTHPRAAKKVGMRLSEVEIENFVPLQKQLRQWHDRKKWVDVPLFNYYIFVNISTKKRHEVFQIMGITKFLSIDGKLSTIPTEEIERIKRLCSYAGKVKVEQGIFNIGDEVDIMEGHFIGLRGQVINSNDNKKIRISIPSLNCSATVLLDKNNVQKIFV